MVQILVDNQYEYIIIGLFGVAYLINMIYYGSSPTDRIEAGKEAFRAITKDVNSMALTWFSPSNATDPPAPNNPYFNEVEKLKEQQVFYFKKTIDKIDETNTNTRQMITDHFNRLSDRVERLEYFTLSEQKKEEYSELKSKDNKHTN